MKYLSDSVMLDTLKKVQALQPSILEAGYSAHLDANVHQNWPFIDSTHITFELTVFEENEIVETFDFSACDTQEVLEATYDMLVAYTRKLRHV